MTETPTTTVIEEGARARLTEDYTDQHALGGPRTYRKGTEFEVADYISAEEAEEGVAFYWGNINGGYSNIAPDASIVEQVMSAEQMAARTIPTPEGILKALGSALCGMDGDTFTTDETSIDKTRNAVEVAGKTEDGLRFAFTVQLTHLHQTDF